MGANSNAAAQDELARVLEDNMGLVVLLAKSFNPRNEDEYEEFVHLGRIGLWKAHLKYDPARSRFSTMAYYYIRWEILRHLSKKPSEAQLDEAIVIEDTKFNLDNIWEYLPKNLSDKERKVIELRLVDNHTFVDIGKIMGYSRGWANNTYKSALEKIEHANQEKKNTVV